jgi:hypothetical protein
MALDQEVVGSNPGVVYRMDGSNDASFYIKEKIENKGSQMWLKQNFIFKRGIIIFHLIIDHLRIIILVS